MARRIPIVRIISEAESVFGILLRNEFNHYVF